MLRDGLRGGFGLREAPVYRGGPEAPPRFRVKLWPGSKCPRPAFPHSPRHPPAGTKRSEGTVAARVACVIRSSRPYGTPGRFYAALCSIGAVFFSSQCLPDADGHGDGRFAGGSAEGRGRTRRCPVLTWPVSCGRSRDRPRFRRGSATATGTSRLLPARCAVMPAKSGSSASWPSPRSRARRAWPVFGFGMRPRECARST